MNQTTKETIKNKVDDTILRDIPVGYLVYSNNDMSTELMTLDDANKYIQDHKIEKGFLLEFKATELYSITKSEVITIKNII